MQQRTERLCWGLSALCLLGAVLLSRDGATVRATARSGDGRLNAVLMFDPDQLADTAAHTVAHDPFRVARTPSDVSFGTPDLPATPPVPPATTFQALALKGVLGGPPWQAVFTGVPNRDANVVARVGDTLAGLRLIRVHRDAVVLRGRDTLVTLTLIRTWQ
jgi:hypothetical protein